MIEKVVARIETEITNLCAIPCPSDLYEQGAATGQINGLRLSLAIIERVQAAERGNAFLAELIHDLETNRLYVEDLGEPGQRFLELLRR